uniref:Uncharacterized protein LOC111127808 isoform X2 n=1 Tax=Crassostrea virginica TaxID=6565 RepID=A0A8B8DP59_CRAVI|nr:uncharacterized protein LOC111127808 isoform X2 [Crassostrea virginica]
MNSPKYRRLAVLTTILLLHVPVYQSRFIPGFEYLVYRTEYCPRSEEEYKGRSSALGCTVNSSYACMPNEELTELWEFCYPLQILYITPDTCLFLSRRIWHLDSHNCKNFKYGCPALHYRASEIYKYPSCVSIANGCFSAEPDCKRKNSGKESDEQNKVSSEKQEDVLANSKLTDYLMSILLILGVIILILCLRPIFNILTRIIKIPKRCRFVKDIGVLLRSIRHVLARRLFMKKAFKFKNTSAEEELLMTEGLDNACRDGDYNTVYSLLLKGVNTNLKIGDYKNTPLILACQNGHKCIVQILLDFDADPNICNFDKASPLLVATENGNTDIVELLLNYNGNVNACNFSGVSPLFVAAKKGNYSLVETLLNKGARVDIEKYNPIKKAIAGNHDKIVECLLQHCSREGVDIHKKCGLLYFAYCKRNMDIVKLLLRHGAPPLTKEEKRMLLDRLRHTTQSVKRK